MFEPKIYKKNGLETFRLVGSDGSEFFYEGALDCNEMELYKDQLGRMYYPVTAEVGGTVKYYVELDPQVQTIPLVTQDERSNVISRLVNASPRPESSLPEDIFVGSEAPEEVSQVVTLEPVPVEPVIVDTRAEPVADMPLPAPADHVKREEAASAIHAVFSPKVDILHSSAEQAGTTAEAKTENEEPAPPAKPPAKAPKKLSLKWPLAIGIVIIILLSAAVGVYVMKPHTYDGLKSMFKAPSPVPSPTPVPTVTPSPVPSPTPEPDTGTPSASISELIDSDSPEIVAFSRAHINVTSTGNMMRQTCDLFDYVNEQWQYSSAYATSRKASEITSTLEGTSRDYTVLMIALLQSQGINCRVVFSYADGSEVPRYYPEVLSSSTSAGYQMAMQQLHLWYGISSPQGHSDDTGYWIALSMGSFPGIRPADAMKEFALSGGTIIPLR